MIFPEEIFDIHTHRPAPAPGRIICLDPSEAIQSLHPGQFYSAGIHPWRADLADEEAFRRLECLASDPQVLAIGEIGFDSLRGPDIATQRSVAERQARLAEAVGKPVIWHVVRRWDELLAMKKGMNPRQPWIVHGFRGKPALASQLLDAGLHLSLGANADPALIALIPPDRLHRETDTEKN